jgi:thymidylate synthase (FAD)
MESEDDQFLAAEWNRRQQEVIDLVKQNFTWAIGAGIAKEQARCMLPEGNTVSRMYMNGSIRSWIHYIILRKENGTQKEHQDIALACARAIAAIFPMAADLVAK